MYGMSGLELQGRPVRELLWLAPPFHQVCNRRLASLQPFGRLRASRQKLPLFQEISYYRQPVAKILSAHKQERRQLHQSTCM